MTESQKSIRSLSNEWPAKLNCSTAHLCGLKEAGTIICSLKTSGKGGAKEPEKDRTQSTRACQ